MAREKQTIKTRSKNIHLPEDLIVRIELELYSDLEGRIPQGAQQQFFIRLLQDYFKQKDALTRGVPIHET